MRAWLKTLASVGLSCLLVAAFVRAAEIDTLSSQDASNTARFPENQAPSTVNNGARALEGMLARWFYDTNCSQPTAGSANSYTYAATRTIASYATGQAFCLRANFANTSTATLNISGLGAKQIFKNHDQALASGDIESGQAMMLVYDGVTFQLLTPGGGAYMLGANNLSEITSASTARTNLGLGTAAVHNTGTTSGTVPMIGSSNTLATAIAPLGSPIQIIATSYSTFLTLGTVIPYDNTPPTSSEGTAVANFSMTAQSASSVLIFNISGFGACAVAGDAIQAAVYNDGTTIWAGLGSTSQVAGGSSNIAASVTISQTFSYTPGDTSAHTYTLRMGGVNANCNINGRLGSQLYGGVAKVTFTATEVVH